MSDVSKGRRECESRKGANSERKATVKSSSERGDRFEVVRERRRESTREEGARDREDRRTGKMIRR